jgi:hypothetical protein
MLETVLLFLLSTFASQPVGYRSGIAPSPLFSSYVLAIKKTVGQILMKSDSEDFLNIV